MNLVKSYLVHFRCNILWPLMTTHSLVVKLLKNAPLAQVKIAIYFTLIAKKK
jgi:hypothetical protein